jgi:predicted enzyme related to lactoylglutathione lyase
MAKRMITDSWVMGPSRDITRSVSFYAKFGLKPSMRMSFYAEWKVPGGTVLGLHSEGKRRPAAKRSAARKGMQGWGIMLRVKDIKKIVEDLKRKRVRCAPVKAAPGGALFSSISDPDGNRLTLVQIPR